MTQQSAVSVRRVHEIQEWIDAENFPKALQTCEKWYKKGERSSSFLTKRALVLTLQKDGHSRRRGQEEAINLCRREPPLSGLDELLDLEKSFEGLNIGQEHSMKAWDRAAKADPKNGDLQETRVRNCMDQQDWKGAQQAAMTLKKNFPAVRKYEFWSIFLSYLVAKHNESPTGIFGQLAYKMIKNLGDKTPNAILDDDLRSGRYIIHSEELLLLLNIYHVLGKFEEGIEVLGSQNLGIQAGVGSQEPSLFSSKRIGMLQDLGRWKDVADEYLEMFRNLDRMGDKCENGPHISEAMGITANLAEAIRKADDRSLSENAQNFLAEAVRKMPHNMAFRYAQIELSAVDIERGAQTPEMLLAMLKSFFVEYCIVRKLSDLTKETINCLGSEPAKDLIDFIHQEVDRHQVDTRDFSWINRIQNALEFEHRLIISRSTEPAVLSSYVCRCVKIYGDSRGPSNNEDIARCNAAIPSAMSLLHLSELVAKNTSLSAYGPNVYQACLLLFHALENSSGCEEPCVLLIPFASMLGLIPFALKAYKKLSIKNVQIDNFAHNMFTRISTLHPHDIPDHPTEKEFRPCDYLESAISQYRTDDRTFARQIMSGMASGAYPNTEYAIIARLNKANSICKGLYLLEKRRIERLMGRDSGYSKLTLENGKISEHLVETRSEEGFPNLELPDHPPFVEHLRFAPYPKSEWVSTMTAQDQSLHKLHVISQYDPAKSKFLEYLDCEGEIEALDKWLDFPVDARDQFTEVEYAIYQVVITYVKAAFLLKHSDVADSSAIQPHESHFKNLVDIIRQWLETQNKDFSDRKKLGSSETVISIEGRHLPASWLYFHHSYATLEALQGLALFLKVARPYHKPKNGAAIFLSKERQQQMSEMIIGLEKKIHDHAKHLRSELDKPGFLDNMMDMVLERGDNGEQSPIGQELEKVIDESTIETMLGMLKDAWMSGLEGIGKVKVGLS